MTGRSQCTVKDKMPVKMPQYYQVSQGANGFCFQVKRWKTVDNYVKSLFPDLQQNFLTHNLCKMTNEKKMLFL